MSSALLKFLAKKHSANAVLAIIVVLFIIASALCFSVAKATQAAMNSTSSNQITMQAQQYCVGKLDLIRNKGYKYLSAQDKQYVALNFYDQVVLGNDVVVNGSKYKSVSVHCYYKNETKPRATLTSMISTAETSSSGAWVKNFPTSGTAPSDGIIVATSYSNTFMQIYTSGVRRTYVSQRDKYGQGSTSASCPVSKGESYAVYGGTVQFYRLN